MLPLEVQIQKGCDQYGEVHSISETYSRSFNEEASQFEYLLKQVIDEKLPKKLQLLHDLTRRDPKIVVNQAPKRKILIVKRKSCIKARIAPEKLLALQEKFQKS